MQQPEHPDDWDEVGHAFGRMIWPLLLVWLGFHITLNRTRIELLPDFLGWLWMAAVLRPIVPVAASFANLRKLAFCLAAFSLPLFIYWVSNPRRGFYLNYPGATVPSDLPSLIYQLVATITIILSTIFLWILLSRAMKIGIAAEDAALTAKANVGRWLHAALVVSGHLTPWSLLPETPRTVLVLFLLIMGIVAAIYTLNVLGHTARACRFLASGETLPGPVLETMETIAVPTSPLSPDGNQKRVRFSLLTLILVTTIVALAASQYQLIQANQQAREEVATAKEAVEYYQSRFDNIYVRDREKIYARSVPMPDRNTWRWRVYLPPRTTHTLRARASKVPKEGIPQGDQLQLLLPHGEISITARLYETDTGEWKLTAEAVSASGSTHIRISGGAREVIDNRPRWAASYTLKPDEADWLMNSGASGGTGIGAFDATEFAPDEPVLLVKRRADKRTQTGAGSWSYSTSETPCDGVAIWITAAP